MFGKCPIGQAVKSAAIPPVLGFGICFPKALLFVCFQLVTRCLFELVTWIQSKIIALVVYGRNVWATVCFQFWNVHCCCFDRFKASRLYCHANNWCTIYIFYLFFLYYNRINIIRGYISLNYFVKKNIFIFKSNI